MAGCLSWTREARIDATKSEVVAELMKNILRCLGTSSQIDVWVCTGGQMSSGRASIFSNHCS